MKRNRKKYRRIELHAEPAPRSVNIELQGEASITVCQAKEGEAKQPPKFHMTAYGGGAIRPKLTPPLEHPIIVDLAGMDMRKQSIPALKDHDPKALVGHTSELSSDGMKLDASGIVSGAGSHAQEVVMAAGNGFKWPVSLGATLGKIEFVKEGQKQKVNGRDVRGPVFIARSSRPREVSFLTMAADDDAEATIAAEAADKGEAMSFTDWLKANGFQSEAELTDGVKVILRAAFDASKGAELDDGQKTQLQAAIKPTKKPKKGKPVELQAEENDENNEDENRQSPSSVLTELKAQLDGIKREQVIFRLCGEKHTELAAKAIEQKWDDNTLKVAIEAAELRAMLPHAMQIRTTKAKDSPSEAIVLEAACAIASNLANIDKMYDEKAMNEATNRFPQRIGFRELYECAARANGYNGAGIRQDLRGVVMAACQAGITMQAAAFSTVSIPNILTSLSNKILLEGYMEIDQSWRSIVSRRSVSDFKAVNSYGLNGDFVFAELPPDGEIEHATVSEESYANQARTYAKMFAVTRKMIIDDDLGAMTTIPRKLGRGGGLKLVQTVWAKFLDHASFFTAGNNNYVSGAGTALSIAGLTTALTALRRQTDPDGNPITINGAILLVPPELEATALALNASTTVNTGGAATETQVLNANIYAGRFRIVVSPYLTDATEWYLIADPQGLPLMEVAFLNGRETPVVEQADTDFNTLGTQFRGYFDFGVSALLNKRAAVKANGT